ncbi:MAG: hypothetical protein Q7S13_05280 [Candidatus Omnitrophota bacterium]|nr:hypothetical protein [Candidatus Omnitrophota bacterium]
MMKRHLILIGSLCVFLIVFAYGLFLAVHKTIGNDEIYSLVASVTPYSYIEILFGKIGGEGNIAPLFYLIQKLILDVAHYRIPDIWTQGSQFWFPWYHSDIHSQIILRLNPILFMSLAMASIFYYFARFYSFPLGFYSILVFFSAPMVWGYWADARHYSLWFFLTTVQSLLFLYMVETSKEERPFLWAWRWLIVVHILMAMTIIFSLVQIAVVSLLLWVFVEKKLRRYLWLTLLPIGVSLFYYFKTVKYKFWVEEESLQLILTCFSQEQVFIAAVFMLFLCLSILSKKSLPFSQFADFVRIDQERIRRIGTCCLCLSVAMFFVALLILGLFQLWNTHGSIGNKISARYFIFLTPLGIISTTLFSYILLTAYRRRRWIQINIFICLSGTLVLLYLNNYPFWVNVNILRGFLHR